MPSPTTVQAVPARGWKRPIPVTPGVSGFCVLAGFALSLPVGLLLPKPWREAIPAPEELRSAVLSFDLLAVALVPLWTVLLWPPRRTMNRWALTILAGLWLLTSLFFCALIPVT